ncbi:MAG: 1-deoxy-D-xylulose-5-phosphate reductoisomerase [Phycisphaerales bacterium]|nr:1-deoxy-D-xylulose-5-phosphate reductoisomerase [Phycisphaerales bacterium]
MPADPSNPAPPAPAILRVAILGSTGSIGTQALDTIGHLNALNAQGRHPTRYEVVALCAHESASKLAQQSGVHPGAALGLCNPAADQSGLSPALLTRGQDAPVRLVEDTRPDLVIGAIVGIAGLSSTLRAAQLGINIALANKESLVAGGKIVTDALFQSGAKIYPVDSEHAGLWQCLLSLEGPQYAPPSAPPESIRRVTLTASGGPFRGRSLAEVQDATVEQALNHPTWTMGKKVSIDSATLMNKALELVEAHWLFGLSADQLDAVIHPQSTVHAIVETVDGSVLAHMGPTDMRCPIQHALTHPHRATSQTRPLDLTAIGSLDFQPVDPLRFPAINMAQEVIKAGSSSGAVLNAANEAAVEAFLKKQIAFGTITAIVQNTLERFDHCPADSLESVLGIHAQARAIATELINSNTAATP